MKRRSDVWITGIWVETPAPIGGVTMIEQLLLLTMGALLIVAAAGFVTWISTLAATPFLIAGSVMWIHGANPDRWTKVVAVKLFELEQGATKGPLVPPRVIGPSGGTDHANPTPVPRA